jgi:hypothetical protein
VHWQRGLIADQAAGPKPGRHRGGGRVDGRIIWLAGGVGYERYQDYGHIAFRDRTGGIGSGSEQTGCDNLAEPLSEAGLTGERHEAASDEACHPRAEVGAVNAEPLPGHLHGQGKADLAETHHGDAGHRAARCTPARPRWGGRACAR